MKMPNSRRNAISAAAGNYCTIIAYAYDENGLTNCDEEAKHEQAMLHFDNDECK